MEASGWRGAAWARIAAVVLTLLSLSLGGQAQAAETTTYVLTDVQGTVLAREDAQGNIIARYDYRPYGKQQTGPVAAGPGYTGHVEDPDTGLVYMQQRYYDPEVGRFLSVDPLGGQPGDIWGINRFAYAANNPISNYDPTGESCESNEEISSECPRIPTDSPVIVTATVASPITIELPQVRPMPRWLVAAPNPYLITVLGLVLPGNMAACQELSCMPWFQANTKGKKISKPGVSGKEGAKDAPSWAKGERPNIGENGKDFADRLFGNKYGRPPGSGEKRPGSEWSKIKKWGDRSFVDPPGR